MAQRITSDTVVNGQRLLEVTMDDGSRQTFNFPESMPREVLLGNLRTQLNLPQREAAPQIPQFGGSPTTGGGQTSLFPNPIADTPVDAPFLERAAAGFLRGVGNPADLMTALKSPLDTFGAMNRQAFMGVRNLLTGNVDSIPDALGNVPIIGPGLESASLRTQEGDVVGGMTETLGAFLGIPGRAGVRAAARQTPGGEGIGFQAMNRNRADTRLPQLAGTANSSAFLQSMGEVLKNIPIIGRPIENFLRTANLVGVDEFLTMIDEISGGKAVISSQTIGIRLQNAVRSTAEGAIRPIFEALGTRIGADGLNMSPAQIRTLLRQGPADIRRQLKAAGMSDEIIDDALQARTSMVAVEGAVLGGTVQRLLEVSPEKAASTIAKMDVQDINALRANPYIPASLFEEAGAVGLRDILLSKHFEGVRPDVAARNLGLTLDDMRELGFDPDSTLSGQAIQKAIQSPDESQMVALIGRERFTELLALSEELIDLQKPRSGRGTMAIALAASGAVVGGAIGALTGNISGMGIGAGIGALTALTGMTRLLIQQPGSISLTRQFVRALGTGNVSQAIALGQMLNAQLSASDRSGNFDAAVFPGGPIRQVGGPSIPIP
jgi:hypothetical protein